MHDTPQDGYTAVMVAACGRLASANDCLAELLSASKALDVEDEDGFTALMHAVRKGNTRGVRLLLDAKADANAGVRPKPPTQCLIPHNLMLAPCPMLRGCSQVGRPWHWLRTPQSPTCCSKLALLWMAVTR